MKAVRRELPDGERHFTPRYAVWDQRVCLAPDGDPLFQHDAEAPDDMAAHVRSLIVGYELTVPIRDGRLGLGSWQGIYLWEHRNDAMRRKIIVTLAGEA